MFRKKVKTKRNVTICYSGGVKESLGDISVWVQDGVVSYKDINKEHCIIPLWRVEKITIQEEKENV